MRRHDYVTSPAEWVSLSAARRRYQISNATIPLANARTILIFIVSSRSIISFVDRCYCPFNEYIDIFDLTIAVIIIDQASKD